MTIKLLKKKMGEATTPRPDAPITWLGVSVVRRASPGHLCVSKITDNTFLRKFNTIKS